jgi:DNA-binding transcriptional regulator YdaS (Cro superfamily)
MTKDAFRALLRHTCEAIGGQKAFAAAHGIHPDEISHVLSGRRDPPDRVLAALGLEWSIEPRCIATEMEGANR